MIGIGGSLFGSFRNGVVSRLPQASPITSSIGQLIARRFAHQYAPRFKIIRKAHKGRVPVKIGGSVRGCTMEYGEYGMRLKSEGVRLAAIQLKEADAAIMRMLRPVGGKLVRRLTTDIPVGRKGNETRMGKGKGGFDFWATRVATGKIIFEIVGEHVHEKIAKEALRKAGDKLPGVYEFVKKGVLPRIGLRDLKEPEEVVNYKELLDKNPTKEHAVKLASQQDLYKMYKNRR